MDGFKCPDYLAGDYWGKYKLRIYPKRMTTASYKVTTPFMFLGDGLIHVLNKYVQSTVYYYS